jgi:hypothetical protein
MSVSSSLRQVYKIFVGNLPWTIGTQELRQFGSSFGPTLHATVVFDRSTGLSKGYGFITFATREAFSAATKGGTGSHILEGNHISVQPVFSNSNHNKDEPM